MRLATLTGCAIVLSMAGAATASAQAIYVDEPGIAPSYVYESAPVYAAPAPYYAAAPVVRAAPTYVEPYEVVRPRSTFVIERPRSYVAEPGPVWVAPRTVAPAVRYESSEPWISVGTTRSCVVDVRGFERCY